MKKVFLTTSCEYLLSIWHQVQSPCQGVGSTVDQTSPLLSCTATTTKQQWSLSTRDELGMEPLYKGRVGDGASLQGTSWGQGLERGCPLFRGYGKGIRTCPLYRGCPLFRGNKCTISMGSGITCPLFRG